MPKARQTCTECSMRRQKCDRQLPCSRCVRRGQADKCTREWPESGYNPQVHRTYPRPSSSSLECRSSISASSVKGGGSLASSLDPLSPRLKDTTLVGPSLDDGVNAISQPNASLQFYAWGQENLSDYNLRSSVELQKELQASMSTECGLSNGFGDDSTAAQISSLQQLLPSPNQIKQMVDYHIDNLLWYHGIFHGPTFEAQLRDACEGSQGLQIRNLDLRWTALLFSILVGTMTCAPNSIRRSWGFTEAEMVRLSRQWYQATVTCLTLSDYMCRHHIYSLSTIIILTLSAHTIGFNSAQATLLGASLKIAQSLGLHKLRKDEEEDKLLMDTSNLQPEQRKRIIQREFGRRVWAYLCIHDWFGTPFFDMYSIQRLHFSTALPSNIDEHTLQLLPPDMPSMTCICKILYSMSAIIAEHHDELARPNDLHAKYQQVLEYEAKLKALINGGIPKPFRPNEPLADGLPRWVPWARRAMRTCYAHKIIMLHRPFLSRSFTDPSFSYSRQSCVEASKTILREIRQSPNDEDAPLLWVDPAHMIAACITLVLDIFYRKEDDPELQDHRRIVEMTISMLGKSHHNAICTRGVKLLSGLLTEHARMTASATLANYRQKEEEESTSPAQKRQKFNLPRFVHNFAGHDSFTQSLKGTPGGQSELTPTTNVLDSDSLKLGESGGYGYGHGYGHGYGYGYGYDYGYGYGHVGGGCGINGGSGAAIIDSETYLPPLAYEKFEELFPPVAGFSSHFLFESLLDFEI